MTQDSFFNEIEEHYKKKLPFVVFSKPDSNSIKAYLQQTTTIHITEEYSENGFVFAPFDLDDDAILIPIEHAEILKLEIFEPSKHIQSEILDSISNKAKHIALVKKGIQAINNGEFSKVVLSRTEEITNSNKTPIQLFKNLLSAYPDAFVYCWYHPKVGLWLGATPETLLYIEGMKFKTMSLAGTQVDKGNSDVEWNKKEQEEQQIVTDYILEGLLDYTSSIETSLPKTSKAGKLLHLQTEISGVLKELKLKEVLQLLHPTPAVCGFPKEKAKQFILENEGYNRAFYTGFLGEINHKEKVSRNQNRRNVENNAYAAIKNTTNLFVNLRCMQLINDKAILYVGGGITKDSSLEKEWQETVNKTSTIKNCL